MSGHARIALRPEACTSCMLCVRECPTWCISLEAHQELVGDPGARRPRTVNVLDAFVIDWGLCMYCGICVEVCPFDALAWQPEPIPATDRDDGLRHGIAALAQPAGAVDPAQPADPASPTTHARSDGPGGAAH